MRIGIDAHILGKQKGGVETTLHHLILNLGRLDRDNEYFIYVSPRHPFRPGDLPANFRIQPLRVVNPWLQRPFVIPYVYRRDRLDLIHLQRAAPPWGCRTYVLHMHDALYKTLPGAFPWWKRMLLNPVFASSGRRATRVVTVSEASKRDIVNGYGLDPRKIVVVPGGVDLESLYRVADHYRVEQAKQKFGLKPSYAIFLGAIDRHKNIHVLLEAFSRLRRETSGFQLVIAGRIRGEAREGYGEELRQQAQRLGISSDVVFTGHVTDEERLLLLNGAVMLVFPSAGEGFGLPPLEAMACGIPAIVSDIPALREVYSDAAFLVKADDLEGWCEAMKNVAGNGELRERLRQAGLRLAGRYRWETMAQELLKVYQSAADEGISGRAEGPFP